MNLEEALLGLMAASACAAIAFPKQAEVEFILNAGQPPSLFQNVPAPRADAIRLLALERPSPRLGGPQ